MSQLGFRTIDPTFPHWWGCPIREPIKLMMITGTH